jgi:hypothetical protein
MTRPQMWTENNDRHSRTGEGSLMRAYPSDLSDHIRHPSPLLPLYLSLVV